MRWQAADYIARRPPVLVGYGGLWIAIGLLATAVDAVDWLIFFTLHEPITCSYNCMIEKGFSEEEKRDFPILASISRRSTRSHISGNRGYDSNRVPEVESNELHLLALL